MAESFAVYAISLAPNVGCMVADKGNVAESEQADEVFSATRQMRSQSISKFSQTKGLGEEIVCTDSQEV